MNDPFGHSPLDVEQLDGGVWKNAVLCSNCAQRFGEHCTTHMIPCCPGKCPQGRAKPEGQWWVINGAELLAALVDAAAGSPPDTVYRDLLANSETHRSVADN